MAAIEEKAEALEGKMDSAFEAFEARLREMMEVVVHASAVPASPPVVALTKGPGYTGAYVVRLWKRITKQGRRRRETGRVGMEAWMQGTATRTWLHWRLGAGYACAEQYLP